MATFIASLIVVTAVVTVLGILAWNRTNDLLTASFLVVVYMFVSYGVDPVFIAATRVYGFYADYRFVLPVDGYADLAHVVLLGALATGAFTFGWTRRIPEWTMRRFPDGTGEASWPKESVRLAAVLAASLLVSGWALVSAFSAQASSVSDAIRWVSNKQVVFEGRGYLHALVLFYKAAVLLWSATVFAGRAGNTRLSRTLWITAIVVSMVIDLATGTRSNLFFSNILVLLLLYHRLRRPLRPRSILVMAPLVLLALVVIRVLTRDIVASVATNRPVTEILGEKLGGLTNTLLFEEVQGADAQLFVLSRGDLLPASYLGRTILAVATLPIPRAVFPEKPRGGNAVFTERYFPVRYWSLKVEVACSLLTELWLNFRVYGVALGFLVLGVLVRILEAAGRVSRGPLFECCYAVATWRVISLIRGDTLNWAVNMGSVMTLLVVAYYLIVPRETRLDLKRT
jgi:hypothetical protein